MTRVHKGAGPDRKGPKKLSDVKVDPKFINTFASMAAPASASAVVPQLVAPPGGSVVKTREAGGVLGT